MIKGPNKTYAHKWIKEGEAIALIYVDGETLWRYRNIRVQIDVESTRFKSLEEFEHVLSGLRITNYG